MEPPGGPPSTAASDRDKQLVLRSEPVLALPHTTQQQQHHHHHHAVAQPAQAQPPPTVVTSLATSPAAAALIAATSGGRPAASVASHVAAHMVAAHGVMATGGVGGVAGMPAFAAAATTYSAATQAATAFSGTSVGHHTPAGHHHHHHAHAPHAAPAPVAAAAHHAGLSAAPSLLGGLSSGSAGSSTGSGTGSGGGGTAGTGTQQQTIEKLSRPMAFDKMESLVREMQDPEHGVPVRQQKMFLTSIPYAFMGYDLIEWLMDRLLIEESEALNIANQLCLHGYFFPVNDSKTLTVKDDSSLYRFQTPYYWPWQHKAPDNVEYAIYLAKRSLRNKQRHALEDYEADALASLHKNLKGKWDFISMQAEEQVRLAKERKKGDKIVGDSQERAYWRVHRPPPGQFTPLEPCPIPSRDRQGFKPNKKKTVDDIQREVDYLNKSLNRTRMKMSQACESLVTYSETFAEYDFFLHTVLPSNPWVTEDTTFWQLNNTFVDTPTEKRVKRWAISIEELVSDPTGLQEFTSFLEKEYSHENIRFWIAVNRLRRSAHSQVARKVNDIYEEFLKPGAPCEINIDGKTMESVLKGLKNPSRFTFDSASEHIYMLLLKKDCYPRFIRSEHYKRLLESGIQPSHKKRFFNFGGVGGAKKKMTAALSGQQNDGATSSKGGSGSGVMMGGSSSMIAPPPGNLSRRRGSDRSLSGSAHELAVIGVNREATTKVPHSHSQSNLSEIPFSCESVYRGDMPHASSQQGHHPQQQQQLHTSPRQQQQQHLLQLQQKQQPHRLFYHDPAQTDFVAAPSAADSDGCLQIFLETPKPKALAARLETTIESAATSAVCPWDLPDEPPSTQAPVAPKSPALATANTAAVTAAQVQLSVCPWEQETIEPSPVVSVTVLKNNTQRLTSTSSDNTDVSDRLQRNLGIRHQNTVDSGESGIKRLMPNFTEQRRASVSFTPSRATDYTAGQSKGLRVMKNSSTISPTVGSQGVVCDSAFAPLFTPLLAQCGRAYSGSSGSGPIGKPSSSDLAIDEELKRLNVAEAHAREQPASPIPTPVATPTPPPLTKITPPPPPSAPPTTVVVPEEEEEEEQAEEEAQEQVEAEKPIEVKSSQVSPQQTAAAVESQETEIAPMVQEVKIELIETIEFEKDNSSLQLMEVATVKLEMPDTTTPKATCVLVVEDKPSSGQTVRSGQAKPSRSSARESPEMELAVLVATPERRAGGHSPSNSLSSEAAMTPPLPSPPPPPSQTSQASKSAAGEQDDDAFAGQDELSPTTDEYQEGLQFGEDGKDVYDYDISDTVSRTGYIPPAPTPAPSMAPLAELDADTVDDDLLGDDFTAPVDIPDAPCAIGSSEAQTSANVGVVAAAAAATTSSATTPVEDVKKRRKKRNSDGKKMASLDEKDKEKAGPSGEVAPATKSEADRNTVCPWEDENVSTSDGTFVKTYATLGYL